MTEKISREEKKQARAQENLQKKEEKTLADAKAQLAYLAEDFKRVKLALQMSSDPYSYMGMEGRLKSLEMSIRELSHEHGLDADATMESLGGFSAEEVKELGRHRLDELNKERLMHEIKVKMGDPVAREKFYEFEHKARRIVEAYGLDESHLEPFIVPDIPPEVEEKIAQRPGSTEDQTEQPRPVLENVPKEKTGFFKKLFGGADKEEKRLRKEHAEHARVTEVIARQDQRYADMLNYIAQAERENNPALVKQLSSVLARIEAEAKDTVNTYGGELSDAELGRFTHLREAADKVTTPSRENGFQKFKENFKQKFRKFFTVGLFTAAAVAKPLPTSDLAPIPTSEGKKIEMAAPVQTVTPAGEKKTDEQVFAQTYAKVAQAERETQYKEQTPTDTVAATPRPVDSVEKLDYHPLTEMKIDTTARQAKFMDSIRAFDQAEKQKLDTNKAPVYPPLPTAPVSPGDSPDKPTHIFRAPTVVGVNSAPAYQVLDSTSFEQATPSVEGIKVSYSDEKGARLNMDSLEKKLPRIIKKSKQTQDTMGVKKEVFPTQAKEITAQIFTSFKKNLLERDFTNPNSYKKALQTIITMYQLNKIAGSWYMDPKIVAPNQPLTDRIMNTPQTYFETKGGTGLGIQNFMPVLTTTMNYAKQNQEHFGQVVMCMFHEYVHAWQRSSAGITDHVEREAQAHYFTLFPSQFSEWRRTNYRPMDASGNPSAEQYPEIIASFPELDERHKIMYASDFEKYYAQLSSEKQAKYKPMHEKVLDLITSIGKEKYSEYKAALAAAEQERVSDVVSARQDTLAPLDVVEVQPFAEFTQTQALFAPKDVPPLPPVAAIERAPEKRVSSLEVSSIVPAAVKIPKNKSLEQVAVPNITPTKTRVQETIAPLETVLPSMPIQNTKSAEPQPVATPDLPITPPEFPLGVKPLQPGEEYSPVKFDFKDVPPAK